MRLKTFALVLLVLCPSLTEAAVIYSESR